MTWQQSTKFPNSTFVLYLSWCSCPENGTMTEHKGCYDQWYNCLAVQWCTSLTSPPSYPKLYTSSSQWATLWRAVCASLICSFVHKKWGLSICCWHSSSSLFVFVSTMFERPVTWFAFSILHNITGKCLYTVYLNSHQTASKSGSNICQNAWLVVELFLRRDGSTSADVFKLQWGR